MSAFTVMPGIVAAAAVGPVVSPNSSNVVYTRLTHPGIAFARIEYRDTGVEYQNVDGESISMTTSRGNWLDSGAASGVWVQRVLDIGTLSLDPGSGRLQLSTSRIFGVQFTSANGSKSCTLTFNFYNASSGGSLIGSQQITLTANKIT